ncbi:MULTISPECIES: hypothetical protein [unclassified Bradyrhizobium]|uniref:hypothetical protein n=1 Tax=unclassified Bradyrhizobium TaxID=2631580 RepID=UPI002916B5B4|nr:MULTISPECIES: hypothetical protein [unclassified Bradyrhizobium]
MTKGAFASANVLLRQRSDDLSPFVAREYDLVLSALSWESRGTTAIEKLKRKFPQLHLLKFSSASNSRAAELKNEQVKLFAKSSDSCILVELDSSTSFPSNVQKIDEFLQSKLTLAQRPLRVLCDISCIPKSYILLLIGFGFRKNYFARFDCVYAEGRYPLSKQHAAASPVKSSGSITSEGVWQSLPVPFFESESTIPNERDVLVALGGEVGLTLPFIEKYEPRRLGLMMISESEVQTPEKLPKSEQYALNELKKEPNLKCVNFSLGDVVGTTRYAIDFCKESSADTITALAIGSKTHALALGIAALSQTRMEVICRIPKRYTMLDVEPNGSVLGFEIEDRFEPNAYVV